jgi:4-cresol dehydrogenase (hydroxylating)
VGLSKTPCQARLKRLVDEGYIVGFRAAIDPEKLGLDHIAFTTVKLSDTREAALEAFNTAVRKIREVEECHMIASSFDYLLENDLPFYLSCPAPSAIAGPVGNTMDRGVGTPLWRAFMMQCGMEVVLANGEVLRTGMGGVEGNSAWQVFKWGYGPYLDGIFTQSNFGICTKMGFWLMPKPPVYKPFRVIDDNEEDISEIVDLFRPLRLNGIIPNSVVYASTIYEAAAIISRRKYFDGEGFTPHEVIQEIREKEGIGAWNVYAALYGTKEQVEVNWNIVKATIEGHGKGRIITEEEAGGKQPFQYRAI